MPELTIRMVPVGDLTADPQNPRHRDLEILERIKGSIDTLGFVLPLYAEPDGLVLSGHQRLTAAKQLGITEVPVVYIDGLTPETKTVFNMASNQATNDDSHAATEQLTEQPPMPAAAAARFRCLTPSEVDPATLIDTFDKDFLGPPRFLRVKVGIVLPAVVTESGRVVNGRYRLAEAAFAGIDKWPVTVISDDEGDYAAWALNGLSMDFLLEKDADRLRYAQRRGLGMRYVGKRIDVASMLFALPKRWQGEHRGNLWHSGYRRAWQKVYGREILDFGAGDYDARKRIFELNQISYTAFEPYRARAVERSNTDHPTREDALPCVDNFLTEVASGTAWSSVFLNGVLQAIAFDQDRRHVVTLLAALVGGGRLLGTYQTNPGSPAQTRVVVDGITGYLSPTGRAQWSLPVSYSRELLEERFEKVFIRETGIGVKFVCYQPKPVDVDALAAAIDFEFDLPYADGRSLGRTGEARAAFATRHRLEGLAD